MQRIRSTFRERAALAFIVAAATGLCVLVGRELITQGTDVGRWDLLFDSAWITVVAGLWLARGLPERFAATVERLANRGAFATVDGQASRAEITAVEDELRAAAGRSEHVWGVVIGVLIAASFVIAKSTNAADGLTAGQLAVSVAVATCAGAFGGLIAGRVIGRMLTYGGLGRALARQRMSFRATPGHVDGAAGLKPLGDYYLHQSLLLAIPVVFLLVWSLLLIAPEFEQRYENWREVYLVLLAVAICLEWAAFGAPLRRAHDAMRRQKREALVAADSVLAPEITRARRELERDLEPDRRTAVRARLDQLTASYHEIDTMPTWPVDRTLRRRVTLGNIAVVVPLVIQVSTEAAKALD